MYVEEQDEVPWDTLNVIVADVTYGGRVTDVWDKRTIASIMRLYFDPGLLDDSYRFRYRKLFFAFHSKPQAAACFIILASFRMVRFADFTLIQDFWMIRVVSGAVRCSPCVPKP